MKLNTLFAAAVLSSTLLSPLVLADIIPAKLPEIKALQYHQPQLISAGLPSENEIGALADAGVEVVINLIPTEMKNQLNDEASLVAAAGMAYHQIDVDWQQPTEANYDQFVQLMQQYHHKSVLVHCQLNWRASAFVYLYQRSLGNDDLSIMAPWGDLEQSLAKYPQWAQLLARVKQR